MLEEAVEVHGGLQSNNIWQRRAVIGGGAKLARASTVELKAIDFDELGKLNLFVSHQHMHGMRVSRPRRHKLAKPSASYNVNGEDRGTVANLVTSIKLPVHL